MAASILSLSILQNILMFLHTHKTLIAHEGLCVSLHGICRQFVEGEEMCVCVHVHVNVRKDEIWMKL